MLRLMVVDDNAAVRALIRACAKRDDDVTVVAEAGDGQQAIAQAGRHQPDIVLLDVDMPHVDGEATIGPLRAAAPHASIVMFSAHEHRRAGCMAAGADAWVEKGSSWPVIRRALVDTGLKGAGGG